MPCTSPDCGQVKRPFSNRLAQTQSPLPSQTRTFNRLRWALQNKKRCPKRVTRQSVPDQTVQPLEPLAHVGDSGGQIDPCGWTQSKHGLRPLQRTHQTLQRIHIKVRMDLDPAAAREHHSQPTTRFVLRRRFPGGQLHRHQPAGRRSSSTLSLPALLLQMTVKRAKAQTPTPAKLGASHAAAHELSH